MATTLAIALMLASRAHAQAAPFVPPDDPSYRDLDALYASGFGRSLIWGSRPFTVAFFREVIAEASDTARALPSPRSMEALERLRARFASDSGRAWRSGSLQLSAARTSLRPVRSALEDRDIDADLAPLTQEPSGRAIPDGLSAGAEAWEARQLTPHFVAAVQPRLVVARPQAGSGAVEAQLVAAYARGVFGNLAVDVGRNALSRGASAGAGPMLSGNARGLDMLRVSMAHPRTLPWILRAFGPTQFGVSASALGNNRDNAGGVLVAWEASARPARPLELGITLVSQQGGRGAPPASLGERLLDALFIAKRALGVTRILWNDPQISDKLFGAQARVVIPRTGLETYLELATSDDDEFFVTHPTKSLWNEAAWLAGARWRGLGGQGRLDAWAEAARNGVNVYLHPHFTSGLTLDRRLLGSPLGPLASGVRGGVDWNGRASRWSITTASERYSGDVWGFTSQDVGYVRQVDRPDEVRLRVTLEWDRRPRAAEAFRWNVQAGAGRVVRSGFGDAGRTNLLLQVSIGQAR